jgi:hypothetical protein
MPSLQTKGIPLKEPPNLVLAGLPKTAFLAMLSIGGQKSLL